MTAMAAGAFPVQVPGEDERGLPPAGAASSGGLRRLRLLVFAGTGDGRRLAEGLAGLPLEAAVSVATEVGREELAGLAGRFRLIVGRRDAGGMGELLREIRPDRVIDATHPYAVEAGRNIRRAAAAAGVAYLRLARPPGAGPGLRLLASAREAAQALIETDGNVLLATGTKDLAAYTEVPGYPARLYPRVLPTEEAIRRCRELGFPSGHIIALRGPFSQALNLALLEQFAIRTLVTKDGGEAGGFAAKLAAAEAAGAAVLVIGRPPGVPGLGLEEILRLLAREAGT
ncbi:MAG: precorrin-6A reductase [Planctomycetota bacterium]|jgi:precorrin-6x reductase|nr:precorrin-6A reductase [Planctomycetota bacterium]